MKLMCKCGNIEDLSKENEKSSFVIKDCNDGTLALVCTKCKEVVYIEIKSSL